MQSTKQAQIELYRARYDALMAKGVEKDAWQPDRHPGNPTVLPAEDIISEEEIPGGWYHVARVRRGRSLRLSNPQGTPGVAVAIWNSDDFSERYYSGDTVKIQWTAALGKGRLLFSESGRVLASITDDTCGLHDTLIGGSTARSNLKRYGDAPTRNSRDNFIVAASKLGLTSRDLPPTVSFFSGIKTDESGRFHWREGSDKVGTYVDLRAEMNLVIAISNCPHPLAPGPYDPKPIKATIWNSPQPAADDFCRTASEEARRAFIATDLVFATG